MKGKINSNGYLSIYRGDVNKGHYQKQYCPFANMTRIEDDESEVYPAPCGTWCPHFGEPFKRKKISYRPRNRFEKLFGGPRFRYLVDSKSMGLDICHGETLFFDELEVEE